MTGFEPSAACLNTSKDSVNPLARDQYRLRSCPEVGCRTGRVQRRQFEVVGQFELGIAFGASLAILELSCLSAQRNPDLAIQMNLHTVSCWNQLANCLRLNLAGKRSR